MALDPGAMHARIIENLEPKTGHALTHWLAVLADAPADKKAKMALLKTTHGLGHHTAVAVLREADGDVPWANSDDLEAALREQIQPDHRALYDDLRAHAVGLDGMTVVPCKTYTGFKAKRQCVVMKPSKSDGVQVGFALPVEGQLSPAKNLGSARITAMASADLGIEALKDLITQAHAADCT